MDKELIEHITAQLQNHEETYPDGAWERFSEKKNKRQGIAFWPLWAAAALILVFGGVFFAQNNIDQKKDIAITKPKAQQNATANGNSSNNIKTKIDSASLNNDTSPVNKLAANRPPKIAGSTKPLSTEQTSYPFINTSAQLAPVNNNLLDSKLSGANLSNLKSKQFDILTEKKKAQPLRKQVLKNCLPRIVMRINKNRQQKQT
jgi:hypothetical protein